MGGDACRCIGTGEQGTASLTGTGSNSSNKSVSGPWGATDQLGIAGLGCALLSTFSNTTPGTAITHRHPGIEQGDRTMLHLTGRVALGWMPLISLSFSAPPKRSGS